MPKRPRKKSNPTEEPEIPADHPDAKPEPGESGLNAISRIEQHQTKVIVATVIIVLLICGFLVLREYRKYQQTVQAEAYSQAAASNSIEKLEEVVANYGGSVAGGNALLSKADIQLSQGKSEDARITLLAFIDKYRDHPRYGQGLLAIGNISHVAGDAAEANNFYDRVLEESGDSDIAPLALIRKGDLVLEEADRLLAEGKTEEAEAKKDEARTLYEDSGFKYPSNSFVSLAEGKIDLLAIGDVPVVDPPPPPPKPETKPEKEAGTSTPIPEPKIKPDAPKPDAPKPDAPKPDAPKPDAPKPDAPKPDAPKPDAPKPDAPKPDAPKPDAPKPDAPKPDAPKPDAPKPDAPKGGANPTEPAAKPAAPTPEPTEKPKPAPAKPPVPGTEKSGTPEPN